MQREGTKAITLFEILDFFHCSQIKGTMLTVITNANAVSWKKKKSKRNLRWTENHALVINPKGVDHHVSVSSSRVNL